MVESPVYESAPRRICGFNHHYFPANLKTSRHLIEKRPRIGQVMEHTPHEEGVNRVISKGHIESRETSVYTRQVQNIRGDDSGNDIFYETSSAA